MREIVMESARRVGLLTLCIVAMIPFIAPIVSNGWHKGGRQALGMMALTAAFFFVLTAIIVIGRALLGN